MILMIHSCIAMIMLSCSRGRKTKKCSKRYYNMTDDWKAERNAKKRAKRTVNFSDFVVSVASNEDGTDGTSNTPFCTGASRVEDDITPE
ncbi:hypothetical protein PAHAL_1G196600 [Panicum hallii]|uniref:No apical meristem-associated C-terminal domain-containing protein n=1 Tax=Panicum hallii TaxID=206008 RepID=A0A2S3GPS8_9POAL|nr:hypothetical protein PAHAL_1G196600 [Panicum hallii]